MIVTQASEISSEMAGELSGGYFCTSMIVPAASEISSEIVGEFSGLISSIVF
jgi:hypothetical protein